jgi:hypothetical protein
MLIPRPNAYKMLALCSVMLLTALSPRMASATLGEPEVSVQSDVAQLKGSIKQMTNRSIYRVHEMQLPSGTMLREFVAPNGNVFAVAWKGPMPPDLRQAFGQYFDTYIAAAKLHQGDHHHLEIQQSDLVVQVRGHMRSFAGRAYLPGAVPAGMDLGDLH